MTEKPCEERRLPPWWPYILLGAITVAGLVLRIWHYGFPLFGDELSTLWIVKNHGLGGTISTVSSDAEITPPLYFVLAWLSTKLGSSPELVRLPSLVCGVACIPMIFQLGRRMLGLRAGLIAAALLALSPYLTYAAATGRAYSLMLMLIIGSTLALLAATRTGNLWWWAVYAVCAALAMLSHYTAVFVLAGQFFWVLWAFPTARKRATVASLGAAILFVPWLPWVGADLGSPTTDLLQMLQIKGFSGKLDEVGQLLFSFPLFGARRLTLTPGIVLSVGSIAVALVVVGARLLRRRRAHPVGEPAPPGDAPRHRQIVLVLVLALATPVCEVILLALGTDLVGARNLIAAWPGFALAMGALFTASGPVLGLVLAIVAITGFSLESVRMLNPDRSSIDYRAAAEFIDDRAEPDDVVIDAGHITPVPLTSLDLYFSPPGAEYRLLLPEGPPPFLPFVSPQRDPQEVVDEAFASAEDDARVFVVTDEPPVAPGQGRRVLEYEGAVLPAGWRIEDVRSFPGIDPQTVTVLGRKPE